MSKISCFSKAKKLGKFWISNDLIFYESLGKSNLKPFWEWSKIYITPKTVRSLPKTVIGVDFYLIASSIWFNFSLGIISLVANTIHATYFYTQK